MLLAYDRNPFYRAHVAWAAGDLDVFLSNLDDDIVYIVNVDGITAPYASSAVGKEDVRFRFQFLLDTFRVDIFEIESFEEGPEFDHSVVRGSYLHKQTGERLDVKFRFRGWTQNGLLVRLEEQHDAAYVIAFERFVRYLGNEAG